MNSGEGGKPFAEAMAPWREPMVEYACLLVEKNQVLNLISRRQEARALDGHIFPCITIGLLLPFADGSEVLDVGTGGGLPGVPLAIMFPRCYFTLLDSTGKKIRAVAEFAEKLALRNITTCQARMEQLSPQKKFDIITGRAVAALPQFLRWTWPHLRKPCAPSPGNTVSPPSPRGVIYLGGGALENHWPIPNLPRPKIFSLATHFQVPHVEGKWIAYFPKT
ncbi:MAG: 16S rRNA (guanine(527)-N(7))-methyltransferase RsmG [Puniceicoccales bacterium]|nr:16S rRNA (guanine(527)-N(7))-methyltransferase RsmG [Puniceicoccales bacterium]